MLALPEQIETDRLIIQRLRYEDAEEMFYVYASKPAATKYVSWPTHQSVQDTRRFLDYAVNSWKEGTEYSYSIRLKQKGSLIGSIGIINDAGKISFWLYLRAKSLGKGYATEACGILMQKLKAINYVYRIWTLVDVENVASIKVLKKCGFTEEARLYKWLRFINQNNQPKDCLIFRLL